MSTLVINEDGSEAELTAHLGTEHKKGTRGLTEEYLASLHRKLHQRSRDALPEHTHPGDEEPGERQPALV